MFDEKRISWRFSLCNMLHCLIVSSLLDPDVSLSTQLSNTLSLCSLTSEAKLHTHSKEQTKSYSYISIFILRVANRKWKYSEGCNLKCRYSEVRRGSPEAWWYNRYSAAAGANFCVYCFVIYIDILTWDYFALGSIIITYLLTYLLTYSMEQSPSWEANWFCS
jgi:hypothetical protein